MELEVVVNKYIQLLTYTLDPLYRYRLVFSQE